LTKRIETRIEIDAPIDRVWAAFADFDRWSEWNPFIVDLKGNVALGEKLAARIQPPGGKAMTFNPKVLRFEPQEELRWVGRFLLPGVFDGEHSFRLKAIEGNRTLFSQGEEFRGILVPVLMGKSMLDKTTRGFEAMNQALKQRAESSS